MHVGMARLNQVLLWDGKEKEKKGHPAHRHKHLMQVPVLGAHGI